jgi:multidrug resistance efflux pump
MVAARAALPAMAAEIRRLRAELATARTAALTEGAAAIDHLRATMLAPPVADLYANGLSGAAGELRRLAAVVEAHVVADDTLDLLHADPTADTNTTSCHWTDCPLDEGHDGPHDVA